MPKELIYLLIGFFLYVVPLKFCLRSIYRYYSEGGIGEEEHVTFGDIFFSLIPILNIFMAYRTLSMEVRKPQGNALNNAELSNRENDQQRIRHLEAIISHMEKLMSEKKPIDREEKASIKFNFKKDDNNQ